VSDATMEGNHDFIAGRDSLGHALEAATTGYAYDATADAVKAGCNHRTAATAAVMEQVAYLYGGEDGPKLLHDQPELADSLGKMGGTCIDDIDHELSGIGDHGKDASDFPAQYAGRARFGNQGAIDRLHGDIRQRPGLISLGRLRTGWQRRSGSLLPLSHQGDHRQRIGRRYELREGGNVRDSQQHAWQQCEQGPHGGAEFDGQSSRRCRRLRLLRHRLLSPDRRHQQRPGLLQMPYPGSFGSKQQYSLHQGESHQHAGTDFHRGDRPRLDDRTQQLPFGSHGEAARLRFAGGAPIRDPGINSQLKTGTPRRGPT
jgi:hypothetical protein